MLSVDELVLPIETGAYRFVSNLGNTLCFGVAPYCWTGKHSKVITCPGVTCLSQQAAGSRCVGWVTDRSFVCRPCGCNAWNAFTYRYGSKQPEVELVLDWMDDFLLPHMAKVHGWFVEFSLGGFEAWLSKWPESKRKQIKESVARDFVQMTKVKAMVKIEGGQRPSKARLIQFYWNLATQAKFGPIFFSAQKAFCHVFDRLELRPGIFVTIASGMNSHAIGQWMQEQLDLGRWHFYERDGKTWDATMTLKHFVSIHKAYRILNAEWADFCDVCSSVKGYWRGREGSLIYQVKGTVKSGHNDTSLKNSLINLLIMARAMESCGYHGSILVAGDDALAAIDEDFDVDRLRDEERKQGILPEARHFTSPWDVSFISGVWMPTVEGIAFMPKPGRLISRLWWTISRPQLKRLDEYRRAVSCGLEPTCGDVPIIRKFIRESRGESGPGLKPSIYNGVSVKLRDGFDFMVERYHIKPESLTECEAWLDILPTEPLYLKHPVLDRLMEVDLADVLVRPLLGELQFV